MKIELKGSVKYRYLARLFAVLERQEEEYAFFGFEGDDISGGIALSYYPNGTYSAYYIASSGARVQRGRIRKAGASVSYTKIGRKIIDADELVELIEKWFELNPLTNWG